ncbi:ABC transporter permease [Streptomyces sp. VRA16 Mangrove soil]|uniref:ABC transporter permease n=1 Tax=Streptomyces sp. VRA16 Mangrove soil TaxID=2817434 RepID=UPI001A9CBDB2|nr:ABC transporter permease [Streptomyces sp. VRA16 Mangrove soil]MBO1330090.1 ABC transporter permease [Streptomyces sp. VRA16 Mangrove soil]
MSALPTQPEAMAPSAPARRDSLPRALVRNRSGLVGAVLTLLVLVVAVAGWAGAVPYDPAAQEVAVALQGPSGSHWLGTDQFGRDVFSRVAAGLGSSLLVAAGAVAASGTVGVVLGIVGGYFGGIADRVIGVLTNVLFAFPSLLLALALASTLSRNRATVALAVAVVYVPIFVRVARGPVLTLRGTDYVVAATAVGQRRLATLFTHVLPNMGGIVLVQVTLSLSWAVLTEASLGFLGFGTPPPAASLGVMVYDARTLSDVAPWLLAGPGVALIVFVFGLNLLGAGLRDVFDPRTGGRR